MEVSGQFFLVITLALTDDFRHRDDTRKEEPLDRYKFEDGTALDFEQRMVSRRQSRIAQQVESLVNYSVALDRTPADDDEDSGKHGN